MLSFGLGLTVAATAYSVWFVPTRSASPLRMSQITQEGRVYSSVDTSFESFPATVTDGNAFLPLLSNRDTTCCQR